MQDLLWAELKKIHRSNIIKIIIFAVIMVSVSIFIEGRAIYNGSRAIDTVGWYMSSAQTLATFFVLPAVISLLGSYIICREDEDDTIKSLLIIPINESKLVFAKIIITLLFSIFIYLLLFLIAFSIESILHFSDLSIELVLYFFKMYFFQGIGIFFAISPIIVLVSYMKKSYWIALILTEIYSFAGIFMSMSNMTKKLYPITAVFGISGYYETTCQGRLESIIVLLLCGCVSAFMLKGLKYKKI